MKRSYDATESTDPNLRPKRLLASAAAVAVFVGSIPYEKPPKGPAYGPRFIYCDQCKKRMSKHHECARNENKRDEQ